MTGDGPEVLRLKLYQRTGALALSDVVPALENFGFRVIEDIPTELDQGKLGTIHDFLLTAPAGLEPAALMSRAEAIEAALGNVLNGAAEDDPFNRLISAVALSAGEADWLRAWYRYLRQAGLNYSVPTAVDALQNAPGVTRALVALKPKHKKRSAPGWPRSRPSTTTACCASSAPWSKPACAPMPLPRRVARPWPSSWTRRWSRACPSRCRGACAGWRNDRGYAAGGVLRGTPVCRRPGRRRRRRRT